MQITLQENYLSLKGEWGFNDNDESIMLVPPVTGDDLEPYIAKDIEFVDHLWLKLGGISYYAKKVDLMLLSLSQLRNLRRSVEKRLNRGDVPLNFFDKVEDVKQCLKYYAKQGVITEATASNYYTQINICQKLPKFLEQIKAEISARFNLVKAAKFKKECRLPKEDHLMALDQKLRAPKVNRDLFRGNMSDFDLETKICYGIQDCELESIYKAAQAQEFN